MNEVFDVDDGDSDAELDGNRDVELDGDKDVELEGNRAPTRQIAPYPGDKSSKIGKRLPKPAAPNILSALNADSLHAHIVKLSLLFLWRWGSCAIRRDADPMRGFYSRYVAPTSVYFDRTRVGRYGEKSIVGDFVAKDIRNCQKGTGVICSSGALDSHLIRK